MRWYLSFLFLVVGGPWLEAQMRVVITSMPPATPPGDSIFLAGSDNGWNPADKTFVFVKDALTGHYTLTIERPGTAGEFKITRGSWKTVECNADGSNVVNRKYDCTGGCNVINIKVEAWHDISGRKRKATASPNVHIVTDSFYMPELGRSRRILIYLPPQYALNKARYPVIYMHDGQNVFDDATSYAGEWRVDETLDSLNKAGDKGCIVVAIDNGGDKRLDEYSPWKNSKYGGGEGQAYAAFIVKTLKPFVDKHFRTKRDRKNTAIMGSSMGGLISMYTAMTYPDVFSRVGAFSSSYWFAEQSFVLPYGECKNREMRYFLMVGGKEGYTQAEDMDKMCYHLLQSGIKAADLSCITFGNEGHTEAFWAREFVRAYKWLFER